MENVQQESSILNTSEREDDQKSARPQEEDPSASIVNTVSALEEHTVETPPEKEANDRDGSAPENGDNLFAGDTSEETEGKDAPEEVVPSLEAQLREVEAEKTEIYDRYLRLNAEFDNFKKRVSKENADRLKYYHSGLIKELLPSVDSLERAIEHATLEDANIEGIREGIQMVCKMIQEVFEKFGVSKIKADGEVFDPNCHQAIGTVESETVPENHVVDVYQVGYFLHDRIIRPSMVRVAKNSKPLT